MTETSPVASEAALPGDLADADEETQFDYIALQGLPLPFVELRARDADGNEIPWDDETMGELEVRGPWVAAALLRHARAGRPLDGRRLVQDRRHRLAPPARLHPHPGPLEGRDQVRRRVDLVGRARERADGPSGDRRGGRDRGPGREVGRAAAGGRACCARARRRPPDELREFLAGEVREVVAAGLLRVRRRDPEDGGRQVPEDGAPRDVSSRPRAGGVLKAVVVSELGGPERLELAEVPEPEGPSVVQVRAAGVNFMDVLIRRGDYPQPPELPAVLGGEVAGELDGRRVMALPRTGGYAEAVGGGLGRARSRTARRSRRARRS